MIASHIHDALAQVRKLQRFILEKSNFCGYSGSARIIGGLAALGGAALIASGKIPATPQASLAVWGAVLAVGLVVNYGGLALWFLRAPESGRKFASLTPALDAVPPLAAGAVLSLALVLKSQFDFLFGTWMCLYGVAHAAYRRSLPPDTYLVGLFYLFCGAACLLLPRINFADPWPMGLVFFAGETAGGIVLYCAKGAGEGDNIEKTREGEQDDRPENH